MSANDKGNMSVDEKRESEWENVSVDRNFECVQCECECVYESPLGAHSLMRHQRNGKRSGNSRINT